MASPDHADAIVIGSGPNGLVAATMLARAGWSVTVLERNTKAGGAVASEALTVPGYTHDPYSAFYGLLHSSPVFRELGLDSRVEWATFTTPVAAAVTPGHIGYVHASVDATARDLGAIDAHDGDAWRALVHWWDKVGQHFLNMSLRPLPSVRPLLRVGRAAKIRGGLELAQIMLAPIEALAHQRFRSEVARSLICSGASHTDLSVTAAGSAPGALILALVAQTRNMPVPVGGAGRLAEAMAAAATEAGATIVTDASVSRVVIQNGKAVGVETSDGRAFSASRAVVADTHARRLFDSLVGEEHLPASFIDAFSWFRSGSGMFKLDLALDGAVPWSEAGLRETGVVHVVGSTEDMAMTMGEIESRRLPTAPLLVVGQQSRADPTRAPADGHTLWIETHVPPHPREGSWDDVRDMFADRVLERIETFAPGLRERIVGMAINTPPDLEARNPNLVDGDLGGGGNALHQQLVFRPARGWFRYATPIKGLYLCSASAHPGGAVHGMGGRNCARRILKLRSIPGRG